MSRLARSHPTQPASIIAMTVIPFRRPASRQPTQPVEPPAALGNGTAASSRAGDDAAEDRRRMQQNVAVLVLIVVLLALGTWMIDRLIAYSRAMACLESGQRSCMKLKVDQPPR
jgi:hypothetical protein